MCSANRVQKKFIGVLGTVLLGVDPTTASLPTGAGAQDDAVADPHGPRKPTALILEPTKDLAKQTAAVIAELQGRLAEPAIRSMAILGGEPINKQARELAQGMDIVTGTPGRCPRAHRDIHFVLSQGCAILWHELGTHCAMRSVTSCQGSGQASASLVNSCPVLVPRRRQPLHLNQKHLQAVSWT